MGRLIYSIATSLDGYLNDADGDYSWAVPDEPVIAALTEDAEGISTYLYGRRMYEEMAVWETDPAAAAQSPQSARWAATWQAAAKVVVSSTLAEVWTERTRLVRRLDADLVAEVVASSSGDVTVEGPTLAKAALELGVVDVVELLWCPAIVGGGTPVLPVGLRLDLALRRERRFDNGMIQATYDVRR